LYFCRAFGQEYVGAFQVNQAARDSMVEALLTTFDGRFWIPISNILLRLVKGSGFGQHSAAARSGKAGAEECSSEVFQRILCVTCESHPKLFSAFLNRIFNTLNWTITEFSVAMKEMNHAVSKRQANDLQHHQRKCTIMFELSVNLERILEFLTLHLWHVFLDADAEMNLTRLCESLVRAQHPPSLPLLVRAAPGKPDALSFIHLHVQALRHQPAQLRRISILFRSQRLPIGRKSPQPRRGRLQTQHSRLCVYRTDPLTKDVSIAPYPQSSDSLLLVTFIHPSETQPPRLLPDGSQVFLLNHTTCGPDARLFESTLQLQMQQLEKISRALILAPCAGIILNLHRAATTRDAEKGGAEEGNTLVAMLAGMEASCPLERVEYVQNFNWRGAFPDDASLQQLPGLSDFLLAFRAEVCERQPIPRDLSRQLNLENCALTGLLVRFRLLFLPSANHCGSCFCSFSPHPCGSAGVVGA
jgi:hypothetical protein